MGRRWPRTHDDFGTIVVDVAEVSALGKIAYGLEDVTEPDADVVPDWLVHTLTRVVKMPRQEVDRLTPAQAQQIWDAYISSPRG